MQQCSGEGLIIQMTWVFYAFQHTVVVFFAKKRYSALCIEQCAREPTCSKRLFFHPSYHIDVRFVSPSFTGSDQLLHEGNVGPEAQEVCSLKSNGMVLVKSAIDQYK